MSKKSHNTNSNYKVDKVTTEQTDNKFVNFMNKIKWKVTIPTMVISLSLGCVIGAGAMYGATKLSYDEQKLIDIFNLVKERWLYNYPYTIDDVESAITNMMLGGLSYSDDDYMYYKDSSSNPTKKVSYTLRADIVPIANTGLLVRNIQKGSPLREDDIIIGYVNKDGEEVFFFANKEEQKKMKYDVFDFYKDVKQSIYNHGYIADRDHTKKKEIELIVNRKDENSSSYQDNIHVNAKILNRVEDYTKIQDDFNSSSEGKHIVILKINTFLGTPAESVKQYLELSLNLTDPDPVNYHKIDHLILDLTSNGGGYVTQAVDLASLFLPKGKLVARQMNSKKKVDTEYRTKTDGIFSSKDLVENISLLVDNSTASAAELFTFALQGNNRAEVYGLDTYGKGIAQTVLNFKDGSYFQFTTNYTESPYIDSNGNYIDNYIYHKEKGFKVSEENRISEEYNLYNKIFTYFKEVTFNSNTNEYDITSTFEDSAERKQQFIDAIKVLGLESSFDPSIKLEVYEDYLLAYARYKGLESSLKGQDEGSTTPSSSTTEDGSFSHRGVKMTLDILSAINEELASKYQENRDLTYGRIQG